MDGHKPDGGAKASKEYLHNSDSRYQQQHMPTKYKLIISSYIKIQHKASHKPKLKSLQNQKKKNLKES
jgi:hypothetical protein